MVAVVLGLRWVLVVLVLALLWMLAVLGAGAGRPLGLMLELMQKEEE